MDNRKKYEEILKRISQGDYNLDDLIPETYKSKAIGARDLQEDTLGHALLRNSDISVPNIKNANKSQMEKFIKEHLNEIYPELDNVGIGFLRGEGNLGEFDPSTNRIGVNLDKLDTPEKLLGTTMHEAGHAYDELVGLGDTEDLKKLKKSDLGKAADELYEIRGAGHHAKIPKLRDQGSYGRNALSKFVKGMPFKSVVSPLVGATAGLALSEDVNASDMIPLLDQAESVGSVSDDIEMIGEREGHLGYKNSQARKDALRKLAGE